MGGLALCEKMRPRPANAIHLLYPSYQNHTSAENYALTAAAGVGDFLSKPLDREAIQMRLTVAERIPKHTAEIRYLQEMIPICVYCRKVRDEQDYWEQVESYIQGETRSRFTDGACPECCAKQMSKLQIDALPASL